jgi:hypothetical protein
MIGSFEDPSLHRCHGGQQLLGFRIGHHRLRTLLPAAGREAGRHHSLPDLSIAANRALDLAAGILLIVMVRGAEPGFEHMP